MGRKAFKGLLHWLCTGPDPRRGLVTPCIVVQEETVKGIASVSLNPARVLAALGLVALMFSPRVALSQVTWPMFQHDPQHTGRSDLVVGPQTNTVRCQFPLGATGFTVGSPAAADDGTIYVTSGNFTAATGSLVAINPDCTQKWVFQLPGSPASTAPAIAANGTIYVHANGPSNILDVETLTAVNPDGTLQWQFRFNGGGPSFASTVQSSPAVAPDGTIWVGSMDTNLYALNPDGTIQCARSPTGSSMKSSPAIGPDGTVYVVDSTSELHAFMPSCLLMWSTRNLDHRRTSFCEMGGTRRLACDGGLLHNAS